MEWVFYGICVNLLSLGYLMMFMVWKNFKEEFYFEGFWKSEIMMGRLVDFSEFKGVVLFLFSNVSFYVMGFNLVVDGGWIVW